MPQDVFLCFGGGKHLHFLSSIPPPSKITIALTNYLSASSKKQNHFCGLHGHLSICDSRVTLSPSEPSSQHRLFLRKQTAWFSSVRLQRSRRRPWTFRLTLQEPWVDTSHHWFVLLSMCPKETTLCHFAEMTLWYFFVLFKAHIFELCFWQSVGMFPSIFGKNFRSPETTAIPAKRCKPATRCHSGLSSLKMS